MASKSRKLILLLILLVLSLPACSDFRAVFNDKPETSRSVKKKKRRNPQLAKKVGKEYFIWPIDGLVNSPYGVRHGKMHDGIDIDGHTGDPVAAAAAGEVVYSDSLGGYGNLIVLKHSNGLFTAYAHNAKNLVEKGDKVKKGQKIAKVGSTGHATGDHLHFEVRDESGTHDPLDFLPKRQYAGNSH